MKKFVLILAVLAVAVGMAFASGTCKRCLRSYYGNTCPYCAGYSAGVSDFYSGNNSSSTVCTPYGNSDAGYTKGSGSSSQQQTESKANCYEGYAQGRKDASSSGNNTSSGN